MPDAGYAALWSFSVRPDRISEFEPLTNDETALGEFDSGRGA